MNFINLIISAISALFGYRLSKYLIAVLGLFVGYNIGSQILPMYITDSNMVYVLSIVIAILLGLLSFRIYQIGIFLLCFFTAYNFFGPVQIGSVEIGQFQTYIIGAIIGVLAGFLGMSFQRPIIILATSLFGSFTFIETIADLLNIQSIALVTIASIILTVITVLFQFKNSPRN